MRGLLKALGYRDAVQRAMVHATFRRHYEGYLMSAEGQQLITKAAMRAMNERMKYAVARAPRAASWIRSRASRSPSTETSR